MPKLPVVSGKELIRALERLDLVLFGNEVVMSFYAKDLLVVSFQTIKKSR